MRPTTRTCAPPSRPASSTPTAQLLVKAPKWRQWSPRSHGGSIDVTIELPAGSQLNGSGAMADFDADGRLGDVRIKTGLGRIELETRGQAERQDRRRRHRRRPRDRPRRDLDRHRRRARPRARRQRRDQELQRRHLGRRGRRRPARQGRQRQHRVDVAQASVVAKSSHGDVRVGEVVRGSAVLETRAGDVEVGIREGTAAWLDVNATAGPRAQHARAPPTPPPPPTRRSRCARARRIGDVAIRRAA